MTVSNRPRKIESKANRMIDDLFLEIDQVLEPNYQFQTLTWRKQEYFSSQGTYIAQTQVAAHWGTSSPTPIREGFSHSLSRSMSDSMVSYPESKREQFVQKTPEKKNSSPLVTSPRQSCFLKFLFFPGLDFISLRRK